MNSIESKVFSLPGLEARKSGLVEGVNRPNLTLAVSPKYLSNETKVYIFITRIPKGVYIIFCAFSKIIFFLPLVDIYRHPLLNTPLPFSYIKNIRTIIQKFSKKYCTIGLQLNTWSHFFDFQGNPGYIVVIKF